MNDKEKSENSYPEKLYRYRSLDNLGRVIQEISCLHWFSTAENLNDPFDGIAGIPEIPVDELKLMKYKLEGEEEQRSSIHHISGVKKWMVACFTENWSSAPMWAHYASNGAGLCLVYNPEVIKERINDQLKIPLFGIDDEPLFDTVNYVEKLSDESVDIKKKIFQKAKVWEYEMEWRTALLGLEIEDSKGGTMVNLHGAISEVLIGWKAGSEVYTPIIDAVNKLRLRGENIRVGIIKLEEKTKNLRIDYPWDSQLLEIGK